MEKATIIFVIVLLISSYMIMRSEGQFRCNKAEDCDPRGCRGYTHVICKDHKCTCAHGAVIGDQCLGVRDCILDGCPPNNRIICQFDVCTCVPS
ncbi:unnamed protein product [Brassica rapa subsp. trilocularis]|uniref:Defensin-like protein n=1 Tax=Brassica campestris TaxID=3711 RepID=M4CNK3_BRACM